MKRLLPNRRPHALALVAATIVITTAAVAVAADAWTAPSAAGNHAAVRAHPAIGLTSSSAHILITAHSCAPAWRAGQSGSTVFHVANRTTHAATIYLFNPYFGATVAQASVPAGGMAELSVHLKAGRYQWSCHQPDQPTRTSAIGAVTLAPVLGGPAGPIYLTPVTTKQMVPIISAYRVYVLSELTLEKSQVAALETATAGGQLAAARSAWLTAHLTWHRIGGAYDAFGDLGQAIDGTADRLQAGVSSPAFTGFHKVELDLWQNDDLAAAGADTATLEADVAQLAGQFPQEPIPATELQLRAHEILEDALRDELSGDDDYGSGTDMASVEADVDGTRELLSLLAPVLTPRAPDLEAVAGAELVQLDAALTATQANGQWVAVTAVPLAQREQVDAAIGAALETLDLCPELLQVVGSTT
jgi:high-affinity iron transporter